MTLVYLLAALAAIALAIHAYSTYRLTKLRAAGIYPQVAAATPADVGRQIKAGFPVLAVRCYREVHHCTLRQAKDAVQAISRSQ